MSGSGAGTYRSGLFHRMAALPLQTRSFKPTLRVREDGVTRGSGPAPRSASLVQGRHRSRNRPFLLVRFGVTLIPARHFNDTDFLG